MTHHWARQAREAALEAAVAALEAAYRADPNDAQCTRLAAACRDQLTALRGVVDAFELTAADEEEPEAAAAELRARRAAFDRRAAARASRRVVPRADTAACVWRPVHARLRVLVRDSALAAHKAARDAAHAEVRVAVRWSSKGTLLRRCCRRADAVPPARRSALRCSPAAPRQPRAALGAALPCACPASP